MMASGETPEAALCVAPDGMPEKIPPVELARP
jgi:hypothetical protein